MKFLLLALLPLPLLLAAQETQDPADEKSPKKQEAFQLQTIVEGMRESGRGWESFLDRPDLSCGIYRLKAGAKDGQSPHAFDEVYYVVEGKAVLTAGEEEFPCEAGSILYVAKNVEHRFHDVEEDLTVLVFFAKGAAESKR